MTAPVSRATAVDALGGVQPPARPTVRCRDPLRCIVPPKVLANIVAADDEAWRATGRNRELAARQRQRALRTLLMDGTVRSARIGGLESHRSQFRLERAQRRLTGTLAAAIGAAVPRRTIYDAQGEERLPGRVVRAEGSVATGDLAVDEAYEGFGATFRLFQEQYGRNSIDGRGSALDGTVHFGEDYDNAFWDGRQMVFGDGDQELFNRFTISVDVVGHELTHGVTDRTAGLVYWHQAGALNESISDVFGSLVKQYVLNQKADDADWLIGAGLLAAGVNGVALRSMSDPGTAYNDPVLGDDDQPAHMDDYVRTFDDNGGVHTNSGIPNHAFYLAATDLGGFAWEEAGLIWYETVTGGTLPKFARFEVFARHTSVTAARLFGVSSRQFKAVAGAWAAVGVQI
jgi:Zn-dependent metalloprotease